LEPLDARPMNGADSSGTALSRSTDYNLPGCVVRTGQRAGLLRRKNMIWHWSKSGPRNFGDWVGPLLFEARVGERPHWCKTKFVRNSGSVFFTAGSILHRIRHPDRAIVWGTG